jgi:preprotein translocase subunit SecF
MQILHNPNFNFIKYRWHALVLSWVLILLGLGVVFTKGLPLGLEFSGGTAVLLQFDRMPSVDSVRTALDRVVPGGGQNITVQTYGPASQRQIMVRVPQTGKESGGELSRVSEDVQRAIQAANLGKFTVAGSEIVGPLVGEELRSKGILATALSLAGILVYITFRYQLSFAVGAVVATIHDLLIVMAFLAFFRYDLSLNVIAAILTLTGYSMNDTIVIFDRVRENLRGMRRDNLNEVVNASINQTLNRTLITGGTTFLGVVALFLFGGEVLKGFAFTMIVGVITGTYSSIFIAAAIVTFWRHGSGGARIAASAPAPAKTAPTARQRKGGRSVKAS